MASRKGQYSRIWHLDAVDRQNSNRVWKRSSHSCVCKQEWMDHLTLLAQYKMYGCN
jgi:hypothetical protein